MSKTMRFIAAEPSLREVSFQWLWPADALVV